MPDTLKGFRYNINNKNKDKIIPMRKFSSLLSYTFFHYPYPDVTLEDIDTSLPFLGGSMQADNSSNLLGMLQVLRWLTNTVSQRHTRA
eukprot:14866196-Ditylum_brightwellii.AAC.2